MRNRKQIEVRKARVNNANDFLAWLKLKGIYEGTGIFDLILEYREKSEISLYEIWQYWEILKEAGRRAKWPGSRWRIVSWEPVVCQEDGSVK